jgi:hypothetical protein
MNHDGFRYRDCESIPKLGKNTTFGNEESMTYSMFFAVFSDSWQYFHSLYHSTHLTN